MRLQATLKATPEDFIVDEIDAYPAEGTGTHTLVRIRKRGLTTDAALRRLADELHIDPRDCGAAGLKDRDAITTQRISLPGVDPAAALALAGRWTDLDILEAVRHPHKLKPGHLRGNRFRIILRDVAPDVVPHAPESAADDADDVIVDEVTNRFLQLGREGFPNAFGPQRFGRDGDNAERALAFVRGEARPPRDPRERRFLFSALQSRWFNALLAERVADGSFRTPRRGDLLKKHATGGMFICEDEATERTRAETFELSPTGPIFGAKMPRPGDDVFARERVPLDADRVSLDDLGRWRALGEGSRRPLRLPIEGMRVQRVAPGAVCVEMTLPKGAYATTVVAGVVEIRARAPFAHAAEHGSEHRPEHQKEGGEPDLC